MRKVLLSRHMTDLFIKGHLSTAHMTAGSLVAEKVCVGNTDADEDLLKMVARFFQTNCSG